MFLMSIAKFAIITFIELVDIQQTSRSEMTIAYMRSGYPYLEALLLGIGFSIVFIFINNLANRIKKIRKLSFGAIITLKSVLFFLGMVGIMTLLFYSAQLINFYPIQDLEALINERHAGLLQLVTLLYFIGMAVLLNFLLILARKFGISNLMNLIIGKYASPKEENKIFLFMDLRSSTQYGEQLDHYKYSKLLRDCFSELNSLVSKYNAEIYQYVGDEVVLTWDLNQNNNKSNAVDIYFSFQRSLKEKERYFIEKYGVLPEFKAGVHGGKVTVTEIGDLKRELAYHGDAINTASRIQGACNQFNARCLISEDLLTTIVDLYGYSQTSLGSIKLKGKKKTVAIYALEANSV